MYNAAATTAKLTVTRATPVVTVVPQTLTYSQATQTLQASVDYSGAVAPTGVLRLQVDTGTRIAAVCTGAASPLNCTASYATSKFTAGVHTITASIATDANYTAAANTATLTVNPEAVQVVVSAVRPTNPTVFQSLTVKATLVPVNKKIAAYSGTVQFLLNGASISPTCDAVVVNAANNSATCSLGPLPASDSDQITAVYQNDANYTGQANNTVSFSVVKLKPTLHASAVSIAAATDNATLSAQLSYKGNSAPTGAVTFTVGAGTAVTATCTGAASPLVCTASYSTSTLTKGKYAIDTSFAGDADYDAASSTSRLTVK